MNKKLIKAHPFRFIGAQDSKVHDYAVQQARNQNKNRAMLVMQNLGLGDVVIGTSTLKA